MSKGVGDAFYSVGCNESNSSYWLIDVLLRTRESKNDGVNHTDSVSLSVASPTTGYFGASITRRRVFCRRGRPKMTAFVLCLIFLLWLCPKLIALLAAGLLVVGGLIAAAGILGAIRQNVWGAPE